MAGEYDGSELIKSLGGDVVPQVWDPTLNGGAGGWRVIEPSDLAADAPLSAPSSNIPRTAVSTSAQTQVAAGSCVKGFVLRADPANGGLVYWGKTGVDASHGDVLEAGAAVFIHVTDSGAIWAIADAAGCFVLGVRF